LSVCDGNADDDDDKQVAQQIHIKLKGYN